MDDNYVKYVNGLLNDLVDHVDKLERDMEKMKVKIEKLGDESRGEDPAVTAYNFF